MIEKPNKKELYICPNAENCQIEGNSCRDHQHPHEWQIGVCNLPCDVDGPDEQITEPCRPCKRNMILLEDGDLCI